MITKELLEELAISSNRKTESDDLERIIVTQADASLISPGVAAHYYRFFYRLTQALRPDLTVELGTHTGISAVCLAEGNPKGLVITVDYLPQVREECKRKNIQYLVQDSLVDFMPPKKIDILFIDTDHNGKRCLDEYNLFIKHMNKNGVVFFDDIHLLKEMEDFWINFIPENGEKFELAIHGAAGFGVVLLNKKEV